MLTQATDFREESEALYALLSNLDDSDFRRPTQFKGWTPNDVITHLHMWNRAADLSATDEKKFLPFLRDAMAAYKEGNLREFERQWAGGTAGKALLEAWRALYVPMSVRFEKMDPALRVKWAGPEMSIRSSITARLMETWAHGQELYDLLGAVRQDTDRIRNIVVLGINTFAWTFENRGLGVPGTTPHLRLTAPSGDIWEWNDDVETDRIAGSATEFCQVVTQVRNVADTQLEVSGDVASRWMSIAQCFAGPPESPPEPGTRFTSQSG